MSISVLHFFLLFTDIPRHERTSLLNCSSVEGNLGYHLQSGATINKVAMKTIYRFLCKHKCSFPWDKYQNMQLLGHMVHIYFCKKKNQVFLHSCKDFFLISYSDMRIMNAIVVLTCITLRANEHLLICLFVIFISSSVKCLVISFEHFLIGLLCLWDWLT